jgi:hypothetical protein
MSNNNFSRRRRGMRFRPKGGLAKWPKKPTAKPRQAAPKWSANRAATSACLKNATTQEIERAENVAAGLPPEEARGGIAPPGARKKGFPRAAT